MQPDRSPVFVLGAAHSGTTILYKMLAYHPGVTWFSQFSFRGGDIPGRRRVPGANRLDMTLRFIPHRWHKEEPMLRRLVPRPGEARTIWDYLLQDCGGFPSVEELDEPARRPMKPKGEGDTPDAVRVHTCLTRFSEQFGGRPVLAKLPDFYRFLEVLRSAFPRARFVHIVRDGRPVALSLRPKFERRFDHHDALLRAARHWVEVLEEARTTPGIDLLEVRYEDLCEDVHGVIGTVLRRAGLDPESFPFRRCPPRLTLRNASWIEAARIEELAEVSEIQRDLLTRHGYPLVLPAAPDAKLASGARVRGAAYRS